MQKTRACEPWSDDEVLVLRFMRRHGFTDVAAARVLDRSAPAVRSKHAALRREAQKIGRRQWPNSDIGLEAP